MNLNNQGHKLFMGVNIACSGHYRLFEVVFITPDEDSANEFMAEHPETGLIDTDPDTGYLYIAKLEETPRYD